MTSLSEHSPPPGARPERVPRAQGAQSYLQRIRQRATLFLIALAVIAFGAFVAAVALGPMSIPVSEVFAYFASLVGLGGGIQDPSVGPFLSIRLSRALLGVGVGAALGVAGATLQGLFRNPLADPGLIGVSSGARLGATLLIVLGGGPLVASSPTLALLAIPTAAFLGALLTMSLVRRIATRAGITHVTILLLAGLAITVFEEATVGLLTVISDDEALRSLTLWRLGALGGATFPIAWSVLGASAVGIFLLMRMGAPLDALLLGEREALHLGVKVESVKRRLVWISAFIVAAATAFVGIIGFIGLIVPHIVRLAAGPSHRVVLPGSALVGIVLVLLSDLVARTIAAPSELPIGVVTAFIGAPFFMALILVKGRSL